MKETLHITSGDCAGALLKQTGLPGEILVWHDILYDGPRNSGWPTEATLQERALFLEKSTGGGLNVTQILKELRAQYRKLESISEDTTIVLWFDACLFDQSMLCHLLTCLHHQRLQQIELLCIDAFPGIDPYNGLGQLSPEQLTSRFGLRQPVSDAQFDFARRVDAAFAAQNLTELKILAQDSRAPIPWIPTAAARWLAEQPDPVTGLGKLESLTLAAIQAGKQSPGEIFRSVAAADTPPQYWGDSTLWAKINGLADRSPPRIQIEGPGDRLPQWESQLPLGDFIITAV